jgi:Xaa-Pro aminopeptidase
VFDYPARRRRTTPLESGMTFTDEPSLTWNGRFGVRVEDIIVCEESGGRRLNSYPTELRSSAERQCARTRGSRTA